MLQKVYLGLQKRRDDESGLSEAATAIIVLPILLVTLFVMLDVGFNMRSRAMLDILVQDTVRGVALDGGDLNPRTNSTGAAWSDRGFQLLQDACANGTIRCAGAPDITFNCTPTVAAQVGDIVSCTASFTYDVISPLSTGDLGLGLQGLYDDPVEVTVQSRSSTGTGG